MDQLIEAYPFVGDFVPPEKPTGGLIVSLVWLSLVVVISSVLFFRDLRYMSTVDKKPL